jgi:hypothetical protein
MLRGRFQSARALQLGRDDGSELIHPGGSRQKIILRAATSEFIFPGIKRLE